MVEGKNKDKRCDQAYVRRVESVGYNFYERVGLWDDDKAQCISFGVRSRVGEKRGRLIMVNTRI